MRESQSVSLSLFLANRGAKTTQRSERLERGKSMGLCVYMEWKRALRRMFPLASCPQGNIRGSLLFHFSFCFRLSSFLLPFLWKRSEIRREPPHNPKAYNEEFLSTQPTEDLEKLCILSYAIPSPVFLFRHNDLHQHYLSHTGPCACNHFRGSHQDCGFHNRCPRKTWARRQCHQTPGRWCL